MKNEMIIRLNYLKVNFELSHVTAKQPISCNGWSRGARSVRIFPRLIWSRDEIQFIRLILSNFGGGWPTSGRLSSPPPLVASDEGKVIFISKVVTRHFHALERHITPMKGGHPRRTNMLMRVSFKFPFSSDKSRDYPASVCKGKMIYV